MPNEQINPLLHPCLMKTLLCHCTPYLQISRQLLNSWFTEEVWGLNNGNYRTLKLWRKEGSSRHKTRSRPRRSLRAKALAVRQAHPISRITHTSGLHKFLLMKPLKEFSIPLYVLKDHLKLLYA